MGRTSSHMHSIHTHTTLSNTNTHMRALAQCNICAHVFFVRIIFCNGPHRRPTTAANDDDGDTDDMDDDNAQQRQQ